jgi:hypothetical protein
MAAGVREIDIDAGRFTKDIECVNKTQAVTSIIQCDVFELQHRIEKDIARAVGPAKTEKTDSAGKKRPATWFEILAKRLRARQQNPAQ